MTATKWLQKERPAPSWTRLDPDITVLIGVGRNPRTDQYRAVWMAPLGTSKPTSYPPGPEWVLLHDFEAEE